MLFSALSSATRLADSLAVSSENVHLVSSFSIAWLIGLKTVLRVGVGAAETFGHTITHVIAAGAPGTAEKPMAVAPAISAETTPIGRPILPNIQVITGAKHIQRLRTRRRWPFLR